ncbi:MAG: GNAT family N-acetyltransferase [Kangiellaceae bacterium]|nr:GNAT family N-acetyltransferase [Kangiellaceae bacterium]
MDYHIEYPDLANALYLALIEDAFYTTLEASVSEDKEVAKQAMLAYMDYSILESQRFGECFIPNEQHYGVSIWSKPLSNEDQNLTAELKKQFISKNMGNKTYQTYRAIGDFMSVKSSALIAPDSWYLSIIGILPEFQGQGLGPGLVESVLEKTDQLGVATYLETFTPRNKTFYFRLGYQVIDSFIEPVTEAEYWLMSREAKAI